MTLSEKIIQEAKRAGFWQIGEVDISKLNFRSDIRAICEDNVCRNYGISWACPPATGTLEECRARCLKHDTMLLFSGVFPMEDSFDYEGMMKGLHDFKAMVERLDYAVESFMQDYMILSNEGCGRCKECTWPDAPCRFPDHLYHSIEGYGFIITDLAKMAAIRYNNGPSTATYFGAILFHENAITS